MCSVFGLINAGYNNLKDTATLAVNIEHLFTKSQERGSDGFGVFAANSTGHVCNQWRQRETDTRKNKFQLGDLLQWASDNRQILDPFVMIGNCRAEPTTEWVKDKKEDDQQPYQLGNWTIVHNGTIANDKVLRFVPETYPTEIDSAAIVETLHNLEGVYPNYSPEEIFVLAITSLEGSFAILATHKNCRKTMFVACNYRPIWYAFAGRTAWVASSRDYSPHNGQMLHPYSVGKIAYDDTREQFFVKTVSLRKPANKKALVVCSGGLDSVVAATQMISSGYDVTLAHFKYGSRAEGPEDTAIKAVSEYLGVPLVIIPMNIYKPSDSPLLQADSEIAGGEAGAEFAHEWVPARNLVMLSLATAYCEAGGFHTLALGNNLEEAGAYPDNEPEFIKKFNDLLPFAVGDGKRLEVVMPVGNMMKHEIVALGHKLGAPMHLTWSCYRAGEHHCGTCGPCFMRRTAFKINGIPEVINYEDKDASVN